ncbi:MAG: hypothetical protein ABIH28_01335 [archaeon]
MKNKNYRQLFNGLFTTLSLAVLLNSCDMERKQETVERFNYCGRPARVVKQIKPFDTDTYFFELPGLIVREGVIVDDEGNKFEINYESYGKGYSVNGQHHYYFHKKRNFNSEK